MKNVKYLSLEDCTNIDKGFKHLTNVEHLVIKKEKIKISTLFNTNPVSLSLDGSFDVNEKEADFFERLKKLNYLTIRESELKKLNDKKVVLDNVTELSILSSLSDYYLDDMSECLKNITDYFPCLEKLFIDRFFEDYYNYTVMKSVFNNIGIDFEWY